MDVSEAHPSPVQKKRAQAKNSLSDACCFRTCGRAESGVRSKDEVMLRLNRRPHIYIMFGSTEL